jgi:hypothetical protein
VERSRSTNARDRDGHELPVERVNETRGGARGGGREQLGRRQRTRGTRRARGEVACRRSRARTMRTSPLGPLRIP